MVGQGRAIECDNCKATGSLSRVQERRGGRLVMVPDVNSYFSVSKHRYSKDTEPFETLHFCTVECLVEYAPTLT